MSFDKFKKRSSSVSALSDKLDKMSKPQTDDERDILWNPAKSRDKTGNAECLIRFLPPPEGEEDEVVKVYSHSFKGEGGWYIQKSRTTFGEDDPMGEYNSERWETGIKEYQDQISSRTAGQNARRRNMNFYSNVYVIDDPENPENNGKVFLLKYGPQIMEVINEATSENIDPFHPFEGATLKLKIVSKKGKNGKIGPANYEKSRWMEKGPWLDDEEEMARIWKEEFHSLQDLVTDSKYYKSYEQLEKIMIRALGPEYKEFKSGTSKPKVKETDTDDIDVDFDEPKNQNVVDDDDDDLDWLNKANEDDDDLDDEIPF